MNELDQLRGRWQRAVAHDEVPSSAWQKATVERLLSVVVDEGRSGKVGRASLSSRRPPFLSTAFACGAVMVIVYSDILATRLIQNASLYLGHYRFLTWGF